MTVREMRAWALTAGLSFSEAGLLPPGEVVDLFIYRRRYDDEQHQITRKGTEECFD